MEGDTVVWSAIGFEHFDDGQAPKLTPFWKKSAGTEAAAETAPPWTPRPVPAEHRPPVRARPVPRGVPGRAPSARRAAAAVTAARREP
ncbi:MAG: hypothetical protein WDM88_12890 [Galbitalea sp.]